MEIKKIGNRKVITIGEETIGKCTLCGKEADLRLYGKGGEKICFKCGMKNKTETDKQCNRWIDLAEDEIRGNNYGKDNS